MKTIEEDISTWESEGGSLTAAPFPNALRRVVWAEGIQAKVNARFNNLIDTLKVLALKESDEGRLTIFEMMLVLEERRGEMLLSEKRDCFIHDWQARMNGDQPVIGDDAHFPLAEQLQENPTSQKISPYRVFRVGLRHTRGAPEDPSDS